VYPGLNGATQETNQAQNASGSNSRIYLNLWLSASVYSYTQFMSEVNNSSMIKFTLTDSDGS